MATQPGTQHTVNLFASAAGAAGHTSRKAILGSVHFSSIKPGHSLKISLSLNKAGRKLVKKHGSVRVLLQLILKPSSGLPHVTKVGIVTFHK